MRLHETISKDLIEAMKNGDTHTRNVLRLVEDAIYSWKFTHRKKDNSDHIADNVLISIIEKMIKSRNESIKFFKEGNREDLVAKEKSEIEVLLQYMPEQLSEDEIKEIVLEAINEVGATSIKDMGKVMNKVKPRLAGKADMKFVSSFIKSNVSIP